MYKLIKNVWWDWGEETLLYFTIVKDNKKVYMTSWIETWYDDISILKEEIFEECKKIGVECDLTSNDYNDWKII